VAAVSVNIAWTVLAALIVTTQVPVPEQAPDQPVNVEPDVADAVRVTTVPAAKRCLHVAPQAVPAGTLTTVPPPVPALVTVRSLARAKVAVVVRAAVIET